MIGHHWTPVTAAVRTRSSRIFSPRLPTELISAFPINIQNLNAVLQCLPISLVRVISLFLRLPYLRTGRRRPFSPSCP
jgi:hypothetical protein